MSHTSTTYEQIQSPADNLHLRGGRLSSAPVVCGRCSNVVYPRERVSINAAVHYHKQCFRCASCNLLLTLATFKAVEVSTASTTATSREANQQPSTFTKWEIYCPKHCPKIAPVNPDVNDVKLRAALSAQAYLSSKDRKSQPLPTNSSGLSIDAIDIQSAIHAQQLQKNRKKHFDPHNFLPQLHKRFIKSGQPPVASRRQGNPPAIIITPASEAGDPSSSSDDGTTGDYVQSGEDEPSRRAGYENESYKPSGGGLLDFSTLNDSDEPLLSLEDPLEAATVLGMMESIADPESFQIDSSREDKTPMQPAKRNKFKISSKNLTDRKIPDKNRVKSIRSMKITVVADEDDSVNCVEIEQEEQLVEEFIYEGIPEEEPCVWIPSKPTLSTVKLNPSTNAEVSLPRSPLYETQEEKALKRVIIPPKPPSGLKSALYTDVKVFEKLDTQAICIARDEDEASTDSATKAATNWADLVARLTQGCVSELEKVRAIFRWLTVKNLNKVNFADELDATEIDSHTDLDATPDSPLQLLMGIRRGTHSYHDLFARLCNLAGLECEVIQGYSKSVGYEPGMNVNAEQFKNAWNAVLIDGEWRLVQCTWAARHILLSNSSSCPQPTTASTTDSLSDDLILRYTYDEHYFLTDPHEFIMEFFPFESQWQLLAEPLSLQEFQELPFVRSSFFHCGLHYPRASRAVLQADAMGKASLELWLRQKDISVTVQFRLVFAEESLRNLRYVRGMEINRYVIFKNLDDHLEFDIHLPCVKPFFLEVYASPTVASPGRATNVLKLATKVKIVPPHVLGSILRALPITANLCSEWGPARATRSHGIRPLSHPAPVLIISASDPVELEFHIPPALRQETFHVALSKSLVNPHVLAQYAQCDQQPDVTSGVLRIRLCCPFEGQFALELFILTTPRTAGLPVAREVCKYIVNCNQLERPLLPKLPESLMESTSAQTMKPGKSRWAKQFHIKILTIGNSAEDTYRMKVAATVTNVVLKIIASIPRKSGRPNMAFTLQRELLLDGKEAMDDFTDLLQVAGASPIAGDSTGESTSELLLTVPLPMTGTYSLRLFAQETSPRYNLTAKIEPMLAPFRLTHLVKITRR